MAPLQELKVIRIDPDARALQGALGLNSPPSEGEFTFGDKPERAIFLDLNQYSKRHLTDKETQKIAEALNAKLNTGIDHDYREGHEGRIVFRKSDLTPKVLLALPDALIELKDMGLPNVGSIATTNRKVLEVGVALHLAKTPEVGEFKFDQQNDEKAIIIDLKKLGVGRDLKDEKTYEKEMYKKTYAVTAALDKKLNEKGVDISFGISPAQPGIFALKPSEITPEVLQVLKGAGFDKIVDAEKNKGRQEGHLEQKPSIEAYVATMPKEADGKPFDPDRATLGDKSPPAGMGDGPVQGAGVGRKA